MTDVVVRDDLVQPMAGTSSSAQRRAITRAVNLSTWNFIVRSFGGRGRAVTAVFLIVGLLVVMNVMSFVMFHGLFSGVLTDPTALSRFAPVVAMALALGAYGLTVVFIVLFPQESPVLFHARATGVPRWTVAVGETVPRLLWVGGFSLSIELGGVVALGVVAPHPVPATIALVAVTVAAGVCAHLIVEVLGRVFTALRFPSEIARIAAVLVACIVVIGAFVFVMATAQTAADGEAAPLAARLVDVWRPDLLRTVLHAVAAIAALAALAAVVLLTAHSDHSGGVLVARGRPWRFPRTGFGPLDSAIRELAEWSREPVVRLSIVTLVALGIPIIIAATTGALDVGLATIVLVVVFTSGSEIIVGRAIPTAWIHRVAGVGPRRLYIRKVAPIHLVQLATMAVVLTALGASGPGQYLEILSLFLAIQAMTTLAGAIVPFDVGGGLGLATTSLLAIGLDVLFLTIEGVVLQLSGPPAVAFNLAWALLMQLAAASFFAKRIGAGS